MIVLITFAFLAGIVTILSPCILPLLPIILSSTIGGKSVGKSRPIGIVLGFILSFTFFTLFLTSLVRLFGIPSNALRTLSIIVIASFGFSLLIPKFQLLLERLFSNLSKFIPTQNSTQRGLLPGLLIGSSLGVLWTPCVGPILASVIALAATGTVTLDSVLITFSYALGTAIPMFLILIGGQKLLGRASWLLSNSERIQRVFGIVMILTALVLYLNLDRSFQSYVLQKFPNYGTGLTKVEEKAIPQKSLSEQKSYKAPELIPGGEWFNLPADTQELTIEKLKGKVVVVDFWTYTCINCIRTLPYLESWYEKYKDKGLVILGVHTPEFEFEKDAGNVKKAIADFGITYPVVQDNNYDTWNAYGNQYWPAKYFIDKDGVIRSTHFGEGKYDESEALIQKLLKETGTLTEDMPISNEDYSISTRTPETYLGTARMQGFSSPEKIILNKPTEYSVPLNLSLNKFAFSGVWIISSERSNPQEGSSLVFNFDAKNVYLVMRPKNPENPGVVNVYLDQMLKTKKLEITEDKLYTLIELDGEGRHTLKIDFLDSNIEVYAFTFG